LLSATYVFLSVVGGVTAPPYPLVYALVSFLVTFHPLSVGCPLAAAALGVEAIMAFGPGATPGAADAFPGHASGVGASDSVAGDDTPSAWNDEHVEWLFGSRFAGRRCTATVRRAGQRHRGKRASAIRAEVDASASMSRASIAARAL
jgi:hypothetical protein